MRAFLLCVFCAVFPVLSGAQSNPENKSLVGMQGVVVGIAANLDLSQAPGALAVDTVELQTIVEIELRKAGIPVLSSSDTLVRKGRVYWGLLRFEITSVSNHGFVATAEALTLIQAAIPSLSHSPSSVPATTWHARGDLLLSTPDRYNDTVKMCLREQLDQFVNAYLSANSKSRIPPS